jgi:hypothetical protein
MRVILEDLTEGTVHAHFGTAITGTTLAASDLDWPYGSGSGLRGMATDLALTLCGRTLRPDGSKANPSDLQPASGHEDIAAFLDEVRALGEEPEIRLLVRAISFRAPSPSSS